MRARNINYGLMISLVTLVLVSINLLGQQRQPVNRAAECVNVVYAVRNVPEGKIIQFEDLAETTVRRARLPKGFDSNLYTENGLCPSSKIDVIGRTSLGLRQLDIVVHKYPGFSSELLQSE